MEKDKKPATTNTEKDSVTPPTQDTTDAGAVLLKKILSDGRLSRETDDETQKTNAKQMIGEFVNMITKKHSGTSAEVVETINSYIKEIDAKLTAQLNEIMHHQDFKDLEASWRGLQHLVFNSETGTMLKIRVFNISKDALRKDLEKATDVDQSALFKKIYEEEYGMLGGQPIGVMIGDYEFRNHPEDLGLLKNISHVAASAHAPFITAASPELFGWDTFTDLIDVRDLAKIFDRVEYATWRAFRDSDDSRYVGLCLPHTLMRLPYGEKTSKTETFKFEEDVDGRTHKKYLWGNAAYAFGTRLTDAFAKYQWCAAIRGVEGGGVVQGLPTHTFTTDEGDVAMKCPTEIAITDRREKEFSDLGFIPLVHCKNENYAAFFGAQSAQKPVKYDSESANANARLSTQLQYIMAASRFAHFMKAMMRDKIGSFMSKENCSNYLNRWISNYVLLDDTAGQSLKAKYPLREARIDVTEVPGKPGVYKAVAFLKPHFQLDALTISLRLVAELPPPAKS